MSCTRPARCTVSDTYDHRTLVRVASIPDLIAGGSMVQVKLARDWTDGTGTVHAAGDIVEVDTVTLAKLEASGVVQPGWAGPTGGGKDWAGPTGGGKDWTSPTHTS